MQNNIYVAICDNMRLSSAESNILKNCKKIGSFESEPRYSLFQDDDLKNVFYLTNGNNSYLFDVFEISFETFAELKRHYKIGQIPVTAPIPFLVISDNPFLETLYFFKTTVEEVYKYNKICKMVTSSNIEDFFALQAVTPF